MQYIILDVSLAGRVNGVYHLGSSSTEVECWTSDHWVAGSNVSSLTLPHCSRGLLGPV